VIFGLDAASNSIEDGRPCLVDRSDGIVDRQVRIPLQFVGIVLREGSTIFRQSAANATRRKSENPHQEPQTTGIQERGNPQ
jgi:hypothetical protein